MIHFAAELIAVETININKFIFDIMDGQKIKYGFIRLTDLVENSHKMVQSIERLYRIYNNPIIFNLESQKKEKISLSENYVQAKIYLEDGNKSEAINMLKEVIYANDSTYSTLSFFLIINQNLIDDYAE